jgi:hypothetical protein
MKYGLQNIQHITTNHILILRSMIREVRPVPTYHFILSFVLLRSQLPFGLYCRIGFDTLITHLFNSAGVHLLHFIPIVASALFQYPYS